MIKVYNFKGENHIPKKHGVSALDKFNAWQEEYKPSKEKILNISVTDNFISIAMWEAIK